MLQLNFTNTDTKNGIEKSIPIKWKLKTFKGKEQNLSHNMKQSLFAKNWDAKAKRIMSTIFLFMSVGV